VSASAGRRATTAVALGMALLSACGTSAGVAVQTPTPTGSAAPASSSPAAPAPVTPATPEPNRTSKLSGTGSGTVALAKPSTRAAGFVVHITGGAPGQTFQVTVKGGVDQLLLSTTVSFDGLRPLDLQDGTADAFDVQATGPWSIEVIDPQVLPHFDAGYSGKNGAMLVYTGGGGNAMITGNEFRKSFTVTSYGTNDTVELVSTSQTYAGSRPFAAGTRLVQVRAKGAWSIQVTA